MVSRCNEATAATNNSSNNNNDNSGRVFDNRNGKKKQDEKSKQQQQHLLKIVLKRFIRGFSTGVCVHVGYALIKSILRRSLKLGLIKAWQAVWSKSTLQTSIFLGLFPSLYRTALYYVKRTRNIEDGWNYLISGAISGLSILSLHKNNRQTITFLSLSRAIGAGIPTLVARGDLPYIPHMDILVFSLCTGVIMYSACKHPEYLSSPSYYRSIMKWAHDYDDEKAIKLFRNPSSRFLTCQEAGVHNGSCLKHNLLDIKRGFASSAKIYLPIHVIPVLVYKRNALILSPLSVIQSFIKNMAASTAFLASMAGIAKFCVCVLRNAHHQPPPIVGIIPFVSGTIGAWLGVLFERKSRQRELALFNIFQVLGIFYTAFTKSSYQFRIPQGFTILFSIAMMIVMHAYETRPDYLNSITKAGLKFLVGERDVNVQKNGTIKTIETTDKKEH